MNSIQGRVLAYRLVAGFLAYFSIAGLYSTFEHEIIGPVLDSVPPGDFRKAAEETWMSAQESARRIRYGADLAELVVAAIIWIGAVPLSRHLTKEESVAELDFRRVNGIVASAVGFFIIGTLIPNIFETTVRSAFLWARLPKGRAYPIDYYWVSMLFVRLVVGFILLTGWKTIGDALMRARILGPGSISKDRD